jgi:hypothetical protein
MVRNPSIDGRFGKGRIGAVNRPLIADSLVMPETRVVAGTSHVALDKRPQTY